MLVFNSCSENDEGISKNSAANLDFKKAFDLNSKKTGSISLSHKNNGKMNMRALSSNSQMASVYINFPNQPTKEVETAFNEVNSIEELSILLQRSDATVQSVPISINSEYVVNVPVEQVDKSLDPLIVEAKKFLYTKGFTDDTIQKMIEDNNGTEEDLIPLVSIIVNSESAQLSQVNKVVPNIFMTTNSFAASRKLTLYMIGECTLTALGADIFGVLVVHLPFGQQHLSYLRLGELQHGH